MKRPLIWFCLSYAAGIYCCRLTAKQMMFCGILFALFLTGCYLKKDSMLFFLCFFLFIGGGAGLRHWNTVHLFQPMQYHNQTGSFTGTVESVKDPGRDGAYSYRLALIQLDGERCRLTMWMRTKKELSPGGIVAAKGKLQASASLEENGEGFGEYLVREGYSFTCSDPTFTTAPAPSLAHRIRYAPMRLRVRVSAMLRRSLSSPWRGIALAVFTGDRSELSSVQKLAFSRTGTSHIISVSGLHVSILLFLMMSFMQLLKIPYRAQKLLCLLLPLFLASFMGSQPAVLRACIMNFLFLASYYFWAEADSVNSLFIAAFLILLFNPTRLFQAGFLLSFSATFGILAFAPFLSRKTEKWIPHRELRDLLCVSVSSYISTLVIVLHFYHQLPLVSLLANLLLVPLFPLYLAAILCFVMLTALCPALASAGGWVIDHVTSLLFGPLDLLAKAPILSFPSPAPILTAAFILFILLGYQLTRERKSTALLLCCIVCFVVGGVQQYRQTHQDCVTVVDAGEIDNMVIQSASGQTVVIAGMPEKVTSFPYDYQDFLAYFEERNLRSIQVFYFLNYNKNTAALFRRLGEDLSIANTLIATDAELAPDIRRIAENNEVTAVDFTTDFKFPFSRSSYCFIEQEGGLSWYQNNGLQAEIAKEPSEQAPLRKRPGRDEIQLGTVTYSTKHTGTLQFVWKNGLWKQTVIAPDDQ